MHKVKKVLAIVIIFSISFTLNACGFRNSGSQLIDYASQLIDSNKDSSTFNIHILDVGQGDCAIIECDGHYMMIDGGPKGAADKVYNELVENGISHLDILVVSHVHEDHIGGLARALYYASRIDHTLCPVYDSNNRQFKDFIEQLDINNGQITVPKADDEYSLGSAKVEIIAVGNNGNVNDGIVLLITYGNNRFLFTGDMEGDLESKLCDKYNDEMPVDFLKVGHHGSDTSTSIRFLRMLKEEENSEIIAAISVGKGNREKLPSQTTLDRLDQAGAKYYRTDEDGDIYISSDGNRLSVVTGQ